MFCFSFFSALKGVTGRGYDSLFKSGSKFFVTLHLKEKIKKTGKKNCIHVHFYYIFSVHNFIFFFIYTVTFITL